MTIKICKLLHCEGLGNNVGLNAYACALHVACGTGAPRAKRGPGDSLNIGPPYIFIQRYKLHVLVFHLITQRRKHNKTSIRRFHTE